MKKFLKKSTVVREIVRMKRNSYTPNWSDVKGISNIKNEDLGSGKRILIVTGGGGYSAAKQIESLLAVALQLRGASVDILLCDEVLPGCFQTTLDWDQNEKAFAKSGTSKANCFSCFHFANKTYTALGLNVIKLSDLLTKEDINEAKKFASESEIKDIKTYSESDVQIGEHALAGALRFYATAQLVDKYSDQVLRRFFSAALIAYKGATNLFSNRKRYSHVLLHHGIYVPQGIFSETANVFGLASTSWHVAYREKTFLFSHGGTYHKTMLQEERKTWDGYDFTAEKRDEIVKYLQSRWSGQNDWISFSNKFSEDRERNIIEASGKYDASILMLTNVMWDAQLHYPANAFSSMLQWILSTIEFFKFRPNLELIIRVHPAEVSGTLPSRQLVVDEIKKYYKNLPNNIKILGPDDPANTYELAKKCDTALIYGTKTGVELAAMGIPTIVAGEAWIRGKGLTIDVDTPSAYELELRKLPLNKRMPPEIQERALKYAYHFFFRRMIPLKCVKKTKGHETFNYAFNAIEDLRPGSDKGLDIICDGIMSGHPYVYES